MGNSHSQHHQISVNQWTHSYPRSKHGYGQSQIKVLPERLPPLQLRTTDNGAILQNGGTISCKKKSIGHEKKIYRPRSNSAHRPPALDNTPLSEGRFGSEPDLRFYLKEPKDQYSDNAARQRVLRSRKKYKAPPVPQNGNGVESSSPDLSNWETNGKEFLMGFSRKGRLFKTRAETNKKNLGILRIQEKKESEISRSTEAINDTRRKFREEKYNHVGDRLEKKGLKRSASQEVISTKKSLANEEFQAELLEVAQRLRPSGNKHCESPLARKANLFRTQEKDEMFTSLNIEIPKEKDFEERQKIMKLSDTKEAEKSQKSELCLCRGEGLKEKNERDVPFKKFYFGMKDNNSEIELVNSNANLISSDNLANNVDKTNAEHRLTAVEKSKNLMNLYKSIDEEGQGWETSLQKFYVNFHKTQMLLPNNNTTSCSSSFVSEPDEDVDGGIALRLRPTLPKKILEIPRFSPTAAWRLLSSIDSYYSQAPSPGGSDDGPFLLEDRIHPPDSQQGLRTNHDKSGDSGISGDASPGGCHESSSEIAAASPKAVPAQNSKNVLMTWTPQQDLEEESSSDDLESPLSSSKNPICKIPGARFSPRGQLFLSKDQSFSVPKEDRICLFAENTDFRSRSNADLTPKLNSLKKLKVALGSTKQSDSPRDHNNFANNNWVLSRSVPSSLNNSHIAATRSLSNPSSPEQDDENNQQASLNHPFYSYLANGGRIMYLPEYHTRMSSDDLAKKARGSMHGGCLSKSCENVMQPEMKQTGRSRSPSPNGMGNNVESRFQSDVTRSNQRKKKFTFQSTVRLLENRRVAEKLSREAELKENQRLGELEAMKKVEEEFQKKRAREKANIRHQLRLFSLEEKNCFSLPSTDWEENPVDSVDKPPMSLPQIAQNPSAKKSSSTKKALDIDKFTPTTQILSEFREATRNYKDYRNSRFHEPSEFFSDTRKSVVEHPRVVYDMPKNTAVYVSATVSTSAQSQQKDETRAGPSTPRSSSSDNYRKEFAHGALSNVRRSLTSSDSELSQSHPQPSSRQEFSMRGFTAMRKSRSVSPESLEASGSSPRGFDSFDNPFKTVICQKSRSISPNRSVEVGAKRQSESPPLEKKYFVYSKPEKKMSNIAENQAESLQIINVDGITNKFETCCLAEKTATDSLLRFGLSSLQPFNKAEKSFRPINFNPERCMRVLRSTQERCEIK